jgi:hypothetical protein
MAVKKHANAVIAAQHRAVSNRSHLLTSARQLVERLLPLEHLQRHVIAPVRT